ncbi:MAG: hypothetical protein NTU69_06940 [Proteobacteria bacterium]|nr:hypothetical protein [Pseudomonadota bacterium]
MSKQMTFTDKVRKALKILKPRFDDLADGYADLIDVDEDREMVKVKLIGGRLL